MNKNRTISVHHFYGEDGNITGAALKVYYKNYDKLSDSDVPRAWVDLDLQDILWLVSALTRGKGQRSPEPASKD